MYKLTCILNITLTQILKKMKNYNSHIMYTAIICVYYTEYNMQRIQSDYFIEEYSLFGNLLKFLKIFYLSNFQLK